jgi:DNA-binding transcriptional MerR regulator
VTGSPEPGAPRSVRLRVDELAARAGVSVDTIRYYQRERLLPPPERAGRVAYYDEAHVERLARIRAWQRTGYPLALIRRVLDGEVAEPDVPLAEAVWRATPAVPARTAGELAQEAGVPEVFVDRLLADGLLAGDADDVPVLQAGARLVALGIPVTDLLDLARAHHAATRELVEEAVRLFDQHVRQPARRRGPTAAPEGTGAAAAGAASGAAGPQDVVDAFETALAAVHDLVGGHFRRVLLAVAAEHLQRALEPATDGPP